MGLRVSDFMRVSWGLGFRIPWGLGFRISCGFGFRVSWHCEWYAFGRLASWGVKVVGIAVSGHIVCSGSWVARVLWGGN